MLNRPSNGLITRVVVLVGALLAISAMLLLSTNSQDVVLAQAVVADDSVVEYNEIIVPDAQGTDFPPVQTFKSEDPEGLGVHWDVTGWDADDFKISTYGVLRFKKQPDYEDPTDRVRVADDTVTAITGSDNMYQITIRATEIRPSGETRRALSTEKDITVSVQNVDEKGIITMRWLEPEVGTPIQAELDDPDGAPTPTNVTFTWYVDKVSGEPDPKVEGHWEPIPSSAFEPVADALPTTMHTPRGKRASDVLPSEIPDPNVAIDEGKYLRVVAMYPNTAPADDQKMAYGVSMYPIRAERTTGETNSENGSPDFDPERIARTVYEDADMGSNVGAPVVAMDPNTVDPEDHLTYHLLAFTGANPADPNGADDFATDVDFFDIDPETGQIVVAKKLDFDANPTEESPDGKYTVIVRATDPSGEDNEATVTITAMRANDGPVIRGAAELRVNELDSDDHDGDGEPDVDYMPMMGMINNNPADNVDDADGVYGNVTGNVYAAGDADAVDQATWTLEGDDAGVFVLNKIPGPDEPRELLFNADNASPNYEAPTDANGDSVYEVTLVATDDDGVVARRPVTVFVDNQQELGKVTLWAGADDLGDASPIVGEPVTAAVEDPDGGVTIVTWQWFKSPNQAGDYDPIIGETSATYTPRPTDATEAVYLRVRATYTDTLTEADDAETAGFDERVQKETVNNPLPKDPEDAHEGDVRLYEAMATSGNAVRVEAPTDDGGPSGPETPGRPDPIVCGQGDISLEVAENAETGSFVGAPIEGCSGGQGIRSYDLHPATDDNRAFSLMSGVGSPGSPGFPQIVVGSKIKPNSADTDPGLDYEVKPQYNLVIRVRDEYQPKQSNSFSVTINLKNLNEYPFFDQASLAKNAESYEEDRTNQVATYVATDPDGEPLDWYVTGTDADHFSIANGVLSFVNDPDYENPMDGFDADNDGDFSTPGTDRDVARDNVYNITVRATERAAIGGGPSMSADLPVTVTVTPRDEPGTVTLQWLQPEVGTPIGMRVTDPDLVTADNLDGVVADSAIASRAWYRSKVEPPNFNPIPTGASLASQWSGTGGADAIYTPVGDHTDDNVLDEGRYLLALVTYDTGKTAVGISRHPVRPDVLDEDNGSPDFRRNERTIDVLETTYVGGVVETVAVDDEPDGDTLTYELVPLGGDQLTETLNSGSMDQGNPNNADVDFFEIDPETGAVTVRKMLSYEADDGRDYSGTPGTDAVTAGEYKFIVRATDPSNEGADRDVTPAVYRDSDEITVTVKATQDNEAPKVTEGEADLTIYEANSRAKDDKEPNYFINLGYRLVADANPPVLEFDPANLNLYKDDDADAPDNPSWIVDGGMDKQWFALGTPDDGIGRRLVFKDGFEPDFEDPMDENRDNVYEVTVVVRDSSGVEGRQDVRVEVMNVKEGEKLTLTPEQPYVPGDRATVTAELTDYDGVISYTYWQWYWTETDTGLVFGITDDTNTDVDERDELDPNIAGQGKIAGATAGTYMANEEDIGRYLHARVEYRDGWSSVDNPATPEDERNDNPATPLTRETGYDSDEMLMDRTENAVQDDTPSPTDPDPTDPGGTGPPDPTMRFFPTKVAENTPASGYVKEPVSLIGDLDYELGGPDAQYFVLADTIMDVYAGDNRQAKPGQIAVALSPTVAQMDKESDKNSYEVELTGTHATDGRRDIITVEIEVEGVNEAPTEPERLGIGLEILGRDTVHRDEGGSLDVAIYRVVGADASATAWMALAGEDADDFNFNAGVLTFKEAPDFEMPMDQGTDNVYRARILAQPQDAGAQPIRKEVVVIIRNVDEAGMVALSTDMPSVGGGIIATLDDPDGDVTSVMWQWSRADAAEGSYTDIAGATGATYTPVEADDADKFLQATVMYNDGHGDGKSAKAATVNAVAIIPGNEGVITFSASQPVTGTMLTATLMDADVFDPASLTWQWASSDAMDGTFTDISGATAVSYMPVADDVGMYLQATAMYNDGHGDGKSAMMVTANPVIVAPVDTCIAPLGPLTASQTVMGTWAMDCMSTARTGSYAEYYTFTLDSTMQVEMNLTSATDPYLVLREGEGRTGRMVTSNDDVGSRNINSAINTELVAGTYTVEATTHFAGQTGDFTLSVRPLLGMENLGTLTRSVDRSNSMWTSAYMSTQRMMDSYARSYTFTLTEATRVAINLTAPEDPYLFLLDSDGMVAHESDNITTRNLNSRIDETLPAGTYTIEATTYFPARMGTFHLSIGVIP